jgi:hypothetical protein
MLDSMHITGVPLQMRKQTKCGKTTKVSKYSFPKNAPNTINTRTSMTSDKYN